jgi:SNF2 family DNA or RNA helicase
MKELGKKAVVRIYAQDPQANPKVLSKDAAIQLINRYQYDSSVKVGIFSCNLASQSIDLTASSDVIQYCLSWSSKKLQQSITRAVRPGNRLPFVTIHYLYHEGLIDEHQVHLATKKIEASKMIMDYDLGFGNSNPFTDDLSPSEIAKRLLSG